MIKILDSEVSRLIVCEMILYYVNRFNLKANSN